MNPAEQTAYTQGATYRPWWRGVAWTQAFYFALTGIWPILDIKSFQVVTGPKTDLWLVKFFGALICIPAAILIRAAWTNHFCQTVFIAGFGSAVLLAAGDVIFVVRGSIGTIYLADAAIEFLFALFWLVGIIAKRDLPSSS